MASCYVFRVPYSQFPTAGTGTFCEKNTYTFSDDTDHGISTNVLNLNVNSVKSALSYFNGGYDSSLSVIGELNIQLRVNKQIAGGGSHNYTYWKKIKWVTFNDYKNHIDLEILDNLNVEGDYVDGTVIYYREIIQHTDYTIKVGDYVICSDVRTSEYPQDLLVTFNVDKAQGWNDTQFSLQKTLQIDSSGAGEVRFDLQSDGYIDSVNPRGFLGLTARFLNDNVRASGSVTVWGRIIQKYSAVVAGVLIPIQKQGNEQILGVVSFTDQCSNFADTVSISDSLDLSGLDFDILDAAVNTSYDIVITKYTWTGFESLENICCDNSINEPLPVVKEPISLPLPQTGTVPIPPDDDDPTGETHYGEGGRIGESINIECICNNLIYLTNEVRELQKLKTDLSGLTRVLDGIHQDLVNIWGALDGSLYAHIEGEKFGLASILYGRSGESSGDSSNLQDLLDKIESIFTNQEEGENRKTQYDVLADLKESLDSKDMQVDVYADQNTNIGYSFGDDFHPEKF